jgi:putative ABC transport system ATP-binding protein
MERASGAPAVRCVALVKEYKLPTGTVTALGGVDVAVARGALTAVAGPSGSGKSTLLRQFALIERPTAGRIELDGADTTRLSSRRRRLLRRRLIAYVFQRPTDNLVEYLPAVAHLSLAARLRGAERPDVGEVLDGVGLAHRADHLPFRLSGGEQQRLAFASAYASGAGLVMADEPTAQLDRASGAAVIDAIRTLVGFGATVIACSHDQAVVDAADHVVRLASGAVVEST